MKGWLDSDFPSNMEVEWSGKLSSTQSDNRRHDSLLVPPNHGQSRPIYTVLTNILHSLRDISVITAVLCLVA